MHPRCRSTICAVTEGGTRVAKSGGKNIRVPAEMTYSEYKKVYIERKQTPSFEVFEYSEVAKNRRVEDFIRIAKEIQPVIEEYSGRKSLWSGKIIIAKADEFPAKMWNCDIRLWQAAPEHILLHELIHASSISHFGLETYKNFAMAEELAVQYLSQELAQKLKIPVIKSGYDGGVELLRQFKKIAAPKVTDLEFASLILQEPPSTRWNYLEDIIEEKFSRGVTIEQLQELNKILEEIIKWRPQRK